MRAGSDRLKNVHRMSHGSDQDFGFESVSVNHFNGVANGVHSVGAEIIDSANEVGNVGCSRLGRHQRLANRENQRDVGADAFVRQRGNQLHARFDQRNLDHNLLVPARYFEGFLQHRVVIRGDDFGRNRSAGYQLTNLENGLLKALSGLRDEGGIGGNAIQYPPIRGLTDFFNITGINKELHA